MPGIVTATGIGPLKWRDVLTAATSPNFGVCNIYNTTIAGADLAPTLPQAGAQGAAGGILLLEKDIADTSSNAIVFNCYSGEFFTDGSTSRTIIVGGQSLLLISIEVDGVFMWKVWADTIGLGSQATIGVSGTVTLPDFAGLNVVVVASGGAALTLPTAVGRQTKFTIKALGGTVTVGTTSAQTIDGSALPRTIVDGNAVGFNPFTGNWVIV